MQIVNTLSIDLRNQGFPQRIRATQADANTRIVEVSLCDGGVEWTIPNGVAAAVGYRKPDGTAGLYDKLPDGTSALTISENTVTAILAPQVLTAPGIVSAVIILTDDSMRQLSTFPFHIYVEKNPAAGLVVSDNYINVADAIGDLNTLVTEDKTSLVAAINEIARNNGGTISDEQIAQAVADYLAENPIEGGYPTTTEITDGSTDEEVPTAAAVRKYVGQHSGGNAENGEDGFSPIATVTQTDSGAVITITDKDGTTTATITNGKDGKDGADGQPGKDGADGIPGEKGEQGIQGIPGEKGEKGDTGAPGADGAKGDKGDKGDTGATGAQGEPGKDGADGKDGTSATHSWNGTVLTITSASGTSSADLKGDPGEPGVDGADYILTDADKTEIAEISAGKIIPLLYANAGAHNSIYRGKYLGTSVTAAQYAAIEAGTFDDMYIGDYWVIDGVTYRIAAFDYYYRAGDTECATHHVTLVPDVQMYMHCMNDTDITTGAYVGSKMYTEGLNQAKEIINTAFGSAHILNHRQYLQDVVTDGYAYDGSWYDSTVELMTEQNVYGGKIFSNIQNGTALANSYTVDKSQYPLFAFRPDMISNRQWLWLRDVVSAAGFALVDAGGGANYADASAVAGVRPAFSIKS